MSDSYGCAPPSRSRVIASRISRSESVSNALVASSKKQNTRICKDHTRYREPLPFTSRQSIAVLSDYRVVTLWHRGDSVMNLGSLGRFDQFLFRSRWTSVQEGSRALTRGIGTGFETRRQSVVSGCRE